VVGHGEAHGVAPGGGPSQPDHQGVARAIEPEGLVSPAAHRPNRELALHIEADGIEALAAGHDGGGDAAVEGGRVPVEVGDLDALVDEIVVVRGRVPAVHHPLEVGLSA